MATFKACVQKQRKDGYWPVYIRVIHHKQVAYIPTDKMVNNAGLSNHKEIVDPYVLQWCSGRIVHYMEQLNKVDIELWSVKDIVDYLKRGSTDISFSDYARQHIARMVNRGEARNAKNYDLAVKSMERYAGTCNVMFSHLTSTFINAWIVSLEHTHRAKEMYPICVRQMFKAACVEYNDYDRGDIRITTNPWVRVTIPKADRAEKLAITPEECRAFFSAPLPESKMKSPLPELGRDVAMMVLCLAGINTVDLYELRESDYYDGIIHYKRAKTRKGRADEAYIEMRVPAIIKPLFEKYAGSDGRLFCFHKRHTTSDSFNANVNIGIKRICESMGMPKEAWYSAYTFRHTWGTVAQNDCGATLGEAGFAMNHSNGHAVTRGYIKMDFTPAWILNEKVVDFIFFTTEKGARASHEQESGFGRFSTKHMIHGVAYFRGKKLGEVHDIGFNNVDEVIEALSEFVSDVPEHSIVQLKIENCDKGQTAVYERTKGRGI
jgi:integrase